MEEKIQELIDKYTKSINKTEKQLEELQSKYRDKRSTRFKDEILFLNSKKQTLLNVVVDLISLQ